MKRETPRPVLLADYAPPPYLIDTVRLDVSLHPTATRVTSRLKLTPNAGPKTSGKVSARKKIAPLVLNGEGLDLVSIALDGKPLTGKDYKVTDGSLTIARPPARPFTLEIVTTCNPRDNTALSGLYLSRGIYTTQCEAEGFRRITYFLDRPDVMATYTVRVEADRNEAGVLLSNGNPVERGTLDGGKRHYAIWKDPHPKPSYLFALVGGNLTSFASSFKTMSGREVDLRIYVEPGKESRCAWAMDCLKRSMTWDEQRFGREYDLDVFNIVAVSDFNMGAMENKGLNIFNDRLVLATPETATDGDYANIERVIAHEYFHNWTGNRITCRDWFQLCLKEGLTVYRDQEFTADTRSRTVQRIADVRNLKSRQFPEDAGPLAHPVRPDRYIEINNFYTTTVYEKGAELVRMLATLIGQEAFRAGMDLYFERHDNSAATIEQFLACFETAAKRDLSHFLRWYQQSGTPELVCSFSHDARKRTAELTVEQVLPPTADQGRKQPLHMPLAIGLIDARGKDLPLATLSNEVRADGVLELTQRRQTFRFSNLDTRPVPSILRGFSAPVNLTLNVSDEDLAFQMRHDRDLYNRWQATQDYAGRLLVAATTAIRSGNKPAKPTAFIAALRNTITDAKLEPAYRAQALQLPGQGDVARLIGANIDPDAIYKATQWLSKAVGVALGDDLEALYGGMAGKRRYAPDAVAAGRRALRNRAMAILAARGGRDDVARIVEHFTSAKNATDEIQALALLSVQRGVARRDAFQRFYDRWSGDNLVIDHWFALQAASPHASTLATVRKLTAHKLFAMTNPNKVRALLMTFATANPVAFHRADGAGYGFIAERVREVDAINPQMAARLAGAFRSWKTMEPVRRAEAKKTLAALARTKGLSRDVIEIAGKMID
jgi:aminopeptidase N